MTTEQSQPAGSALNKIDLRSFLLGGAIAFVLGVMAAHIFHAALESGTLSYRSQTIDFQNIEADSLRRQVDDLEKKNAELRASCNQR